jgi:hypothetical protein
MKQEKEAKKQKKMNYQTKSNNMLIICCIWFFYLQTFSLIAPCGAIPIAFGSFCPGFAIA